VIHHLLAAHEWMRRPKGAYAPESLRTEGFVHCSADLDAVLGVANRFYRGLDGDVLVLDIDEDRLTSEVRWEAAAHPDGSPSTADDPAFPHVYGSIDDHAVVSVRLLVRDPDGSYVALSPADAAFAPGTLRR
jgi:uncharacterized protein (DUF952 family)